MTQNISKIYLHWSATHYNWAEPGHYHSVVLGNGTVKRTTGYEQPLSAHTFARNSSSVAICLACMGGRGWADYPPTPVQIEAACKEVALLAFRLKWLPKDISIKRVMTHAEAAANRDYAQDIARKVSGWTLPTSTPQQNQYASIARKAGLPHENYGPAYWFDKWPGGFVERWDLWQLKPSDPPGQGGFVMRTRIQEILSQMYNEKPPVELTFQTGSPKPLRTCDVFRDKKLITKALILSDQRSYIKLTELARTYGMKLTWNQAANYVNLSAPDLEPKYLADAPLMMGYPAIDIYLNRPEDEDGSPILDPTLPMRPMMQGLVFDGATHVLVAEFAEELGIPVKVSPNMTIYLGNIPAPVANPLLTNPAGPAGGASAGQGTGTGGTGQTGTGQTGTASTGGVAPGFAIGSVAGAGVVQSTPPTGNPPQNPASGTGRFTSNR
jgi:hypothetical protein